LPQPAILKAQLESTPLAGFKNPGALHKNIRSQLASMMLTCQYSQVGVGVEMLEGKSQHPVILACISVQTIWARFIAHHWLKIAFSMNILLLASMI